MKNNTTPLNYGTTTRIAPTNKTTPSVTPAQAGISKNYSFPNPLPVILSEQSEARNPFKSNLMKMKQVGKNILGRFLFSKELQRNINSNKLKNYLKTKDYKLKTNYGFTLVELIVVIVILGILATIAFLSFTSQTSGARDSIRMGNVALISKGMDLNITMGKNINTYDTLTEMNISIVGSGGTISYTGFYSPVGTKFLDSIRVSRGNILEDTTGAYRYTYIPSNKYYQVGVTLENNPSVSLNSIDDNIILSRFLLAQEGQNMYELQSINEGQNVLQVDIANAATSTGYAFIKGNFPINTASGGYVKGLIPSSDASFNSITPVSGIRSISGTGSDIAINSAITTSTSSEVVVIPPANSCNATIPTCSPGSCDLTYNPTSVNQNWTKDVSSCGFACKNGYTGIDCMTPPAPVCPSGFVYIPGSENIDSQVKGWCVMKYEASYVSYTAGNASAYYGEPYSNTYTTGHGAGAINSKANSAPINDISRDESQALCNSTNLKDQSGVAISNGKLLTVQLWKKIADDIMNQGINWSSNTPGTGYISRGYADYSNSSGVATNNCQTGTSRACSSLSSDPTSNPTSIYSNRAWKLSNGAWIHDFAGNVWEWYYDTHNSGGNSAWNDYNVISGASVIGINIDPDTNASISGISALSSVTAGLGQIYNAGATVGTTYASIFGGDWASTTRAGVFASGFSTHSPSTGRYINVGFRCIAPAQ